MSNYNQKILYHVAKGRKGISEQRLAVDETAASNLTVPAGATMALIKVEATDSTAYTDSNKVARITFTGETPTVGNAPGANVVGIAVADLTVFDIDELETLYKFRVIKTENNADSLFLYIQYF